MQDNKPTHECDARGLLDTVYEKHTPTDGRVIDTTTWPDEITDGDLVLSDQATDQAVANVDFETWPGDRSVLTVPAEYTLPVEREPFVSIEDPETLPPAGGVVYEIIDGISWLMVSPYADTTTLRELEWLEGRLHEQYEYSPGAIRTRLIEEAQARGDVPDGQA